MDHINRNSDDQRHDGDARDPRRRAWESNRRRQGSRPNVRDGDDLDFTSRQLAGLRALLAIAESETALVPFSGTGVQVRYTGSFQGLDHQHRQLSATTADSLLATSRWQAILTLLRKDRMLRNSLFLLVNSGLQAALGFAFWVVTARFFSPANVGRASSLISASTLIAFLGLLGLNTAFVRYLPIARNPNRLITAGLTLVASCSAGLAIFYLALTPFISKPISFVAHSLPLAIGFVVLTAGGGINVLTDSIFIAVEKAKYNTIADGVIGGIAKIALVVILAGTGAYGVFGAATGGFVTAALASVLLMVKVLRWRPVFGEFRRILKPILSFSGMNYVGNILYMLPTLIVPLIVISRLGASAAAYYYVSFQLASLLYAAAYSVEQAFLAEGANAGAINRAVLMRSVRILLALCIPAFIFTLLFGHQLLMAFGSSYASNAESSFIPLTAAVFPIAAYNWCLTILRLSNRLRAIVWSNGIYAAAVVALALTLAPRGLGAVAMAWPIGTAAGAVVAGVAVVRSFRRPLPTGRQPAPDRPPPRTEGFVTRNSSGS